MNKLSNQPKYPDITVQMTGEDGNAFFILGRVREAMRRSNVEGDKIDEFTEEAMSGDYDYLIQTVMRWVNVR